MVKEADMNKILVVDEEDAIECSTKKNLCKMDMILSLPRTMMRYWR